MKSLEKDANEHWHNKDRALADKVGGILGEVNRDIYSLFVNPVKIAKKYVRGYVELFREYRQRQAKPQGYLDS